MPETVVPQPATSHTARANAQARAGLPLHYRRDHDDVRRGFGATIDDPVIRRADGLPVIDVSGHDFVLESDDAPDTVHPSLWRHARVNQPHGLFEVTSGIYQVRGFDLSNITSVEGDEGVIVIDPLVYKETAEAALALYRAHRGDRPVTALIYTHSHTDHYGGSKGIVTQEDASSGRAVVIAPDGFLHEAVAENVYAGNAMTRRATYMYGPMIPPGPRGHVNAGLANALSNLGSSTLVVPADLIRQTGERRTVDGVEMVFQMAPATEAPAEFLIHFPRHRALCAAEDATHTLHNLYTLRGAQVRDAATWWKTLNETVQLFGADTDVIFAQYHWPRWESDDIIAYLESPRDLYKFIHDRVLHLANAGETMLEIAEQLELPSGLSGQWFNRGHADCGLRARLLNDYYPNSGEPAAAPNNSVRAAAVQAAIWYFTDYFVLASGDPVRPYTEAIVNAIRVLPPLPAPTPPSLTVTPSDISSPVSTPAGPFTIATNATLDAALYATDGTMFSNASGTTQIPQGTFVPNGQQVWLIPDDPSPGLNVALLSRGEPLVPSGGVYIYDQNTPGVSDAQRLILAETIEVITNVTASAEFVDVPVLTAALTMTKAMSGRAAGLQDAVTLQVSCDDGTDESFTIPAGATGATQFVVDELVVGTVCTVTEPATKATATISVSTSRLGSVVVAEAAQPRPPPTPTIRLLHHPGNRPRHHDSRVRTVGSGRCDVVDLRPQSDVTPAQSGKLYSVRELAEMLRVSRMTVYRRVHAGVLIPHRLDPHMVFHAEASLFAIREDTTPADDAS